MKTQHAMHRAGTAHHGNGSNKVVEGARELLVATAHNAEEKVVNARKQLASVLENGKAAWNTVQAKATAGAKATDHAIRHHPYKSLSVALGVGALIGYFVRRRN